MIQEKLSLKTQTKFLEGSIYQIVSFVSRGSEHEEEKLQAVVLPNAKLGYIT
jgi:hypothetical protein